MSPCYELKDVAEFMYSELAEAWELLDFEYGNGTCDEETNSARRENLARLRARLDYAERCE